MAMLAEPRRRQKLSADPRGLHWADDDQKFGQKLMEKMGWQKGHGLGAQEDGRVEHIKVSVKNNDRGVGCKKSCADDWIAHQDDFNSLLSQLNQCNNTKGEETSLQSLEKKSKETKGRVHYQKFTRGKDLSSAKQNDLNSIFGRRKEKSLPSTPPEQLEANNEDDEHSESIHMEHSHGITTISTGTSINDYFIKKMAELKARAALKENFQSDNGVCRSVKNNYDIGTEGCSVDVLSTTEHISPDVVEVKELTASQQTDGYLDTIKNKEDTGGKIKKKSKVFQTAESSSQLDHESRQGIKDLNEIICEDENASATKARSREMKLKASNIPDDDNTDNSVVNSVHMNSADDVDRKFKSKKSKKSAENPLIFVESKKKGKPLKSTDNESCLKKRKPNSKKKVKNSSTSIAKKQNKTEKRTKSQDQISEVQIEPDNVISQNKKDKKRKAEVDDQDNANTNNSKKRKITKMKQKKSDCLFVGSNLNQIVGYGNSQYLNKATSKKEVNICSTSIDKNQNKTEKRSKLQDQVSEVQKEPDNVNNEDMKMKAEVDDQDNANTNNSKKREITKNKQNKSDCLSFIGSNLNQIVGYGNGKDLGYSRKHNMFYRSLD